MRYLRKKYRDLINDRIKKIFDLKKKLSVKTKITIEKNFKEMKYVNFDNDRRFKFIKRVITSMSIITFKITYKSFRRNTFIIIDFIFNKLNNK